MAHDIVSMAHDIVSMAHDSHIDRSVILQNESLYMLALIIW